MQEGLGDQHLLSPLPGSDIYSNADIYDQLGEKLPEQQDAEIVCTEGRQAEGTIVYTLYT